MHAPDVLKEGLPEILLQPVQLKDTMVGMAEGRDILSCAEGGFQNYK